MVVLALRKHILSLLEQADSDCAAFETNQILLWTLGERALILYPEEEVSETASRQAIEAAKRRAEGEPLQYILGEWEFYGLPFKVGEGVLIPRPETEILVETVLKELSSDSRVIDLCSGSGCIPIALWKKSGCSCCGIELSDKALEYFRFNIELNNAEKGVIPLKGDALYPSGELSELLPDSCDVITANPPYLTAEEMENLQTEVRHEPDIALFGGKDGLDFYRRIFGIWKGRLRDGGMFAVEVGNGQAETVSRIMEEEGFGCIKAVRDYGGEKRAVIGQRTIAGTVKTKKYIDFYH